MVGRDKKRESRGAHNLERSVTISWILTLTEKHCQVRTCSNKPMWRAISNRTSASILKDGKGGVWDVLHAVPPVIICESNTWVLTSRLSQCWHMPRSQEYTLKLSELHVFRNSPKAVGRKVLNPESTFLPEHFSSAGVARLG